MGISDEYSPVRMIVSDFTQWQPGNDTQYDVVICSQVLEHIPAPGAFLQKLLATAPTVIVSVPFLWNDHDCQDCHHVSHNISQGMMLTWAAPHKPNVTTIIDEQPGGGSPFRRRMVMVFQREAQRARSSNLEGSLSRAIGRY